VRAKATKQLFGVRAVDASGVADRTAAMARIKPRKK
jgi:hypothetical protein